MYQVKEINGRKINNGYEIAVIGKGANGLCEVRGQNSEKKFHGTYDACVAWLSVRGLTH